MLNKLRLEVVGCVLLQVTNLDPAMSRICFGIQRLRVQAEANLLKSNEG
jgi:hypothetical protein